MVAFPFPAKPVQILGQGLLAKIAAPFPIPLPTPRQIFEAQMGVEP